MLRFKVSWGLNACSWWGSTGSTVSDLNSGSGGTFEGLEGKDHNGINMHQETNTNFKYASWRYPIIVNGLECRAIKTRVEIIELPMSCRIYCRWGALIQQLGWRPAYVLWFVQGSRLKYSAIECVSHCCWPKPGSGIHPSRRAKAKMLCVLPPSKIWKKKQLFQVFRMILTQQQLATYELHVFLFWHVAVSFIVASIYLSIYLYIYSTQVYTLLGCDARGTSDLPFRLECLQFVTSWWPKAMTVKNYLWTGDVTNQLNVVERAPRSLQEPLEFWKCKLCFKVVQ